MGSSKPKDAKLWAREPNDWYVEPEGVWEAFLKVDGFPETISVCDPWAGIGRAIKALAAHGYQWKAADILNRVPPGDDFNVTIADFMAPDWREKVIGLGACNYMGNPPFKLVNPKGYRWDGHLEAYQRTPLLLDLVLHRMTHKAALLLPGRFICSSGKRAKFLERTPLKTVYWIVPRPSMPPGPVIMAGESPGGGEQDFCIAVWDHGRQSAPRGAVEHRWLHWGGPNGDDE